VVSSSRRARETIEGHTQIERHEKALRLLREAGERLVIGADGRVSAPGSPELAAAVREVRAELGELLSGRRCRLCGEPITVQGVQLAGGGWGHTVCRGWRPGRK
jgi:hypothetical protein